MLCRSIWGEREPCHEAALASVFCLSHDPSRVRAAAKHPEGVHDPIDLSRHDSRHVWEFIVVGEPRKLRPERHRRRARRLAREQETRDEH
jgi:hypothetical protein